MVLRMVLEVRVKGKEWVGMSPLFMFKCFADLPVALFAYPHVGPDSQLELLLLVSP